LEDRLIDSPFTIAPIRFAIVIVLEGKDKGKEYYFDEPHTFEGNARILVCYGAGR